MADCVFTQDNSVQLTRGDCSSIPNGATNVTYVAGTVDEHSGRYDPNNGTLSFSYTPYGGNEPVLRVMGGVFPSGGVSDADRMQALYHAGLMGEAGVNWALRTTAENAGGAAIGGAIRLGLEAAVEAYQGWRIANVVREAVDLEVLDKKIVGDMARRGWTKQAILDTMQEAQESGTVHTVPNKITGGQATEYINPVNGKFVVVDNATKQVIQVSGPGFKPNYLMKPVK